MEQPVEMNTLSQILEKLRQKGLDNEIKMTDHGKMQGVGFNKIYSPEDLSIIKTYRFEGDSDPADETIVYAISSVNKHLKGTLINAYGVYADTVSDELIEKLKVR